MNELSRDLANVHEVQLAAWAGVRRVDADELAGAAHDKTKAVRMDRGKTGIKP